MIVKLYLPYIEQLVNNIDAYIKHLHQTNLNKYQQGLDVTESDSQIVGLLMLMYSLKNIQLVEQAKQSQNDQRSQYLQRRRELLFGYLAVRHDSELSLAIDNLQVELNELAKSMHVHTLIEIEIEENLYTLLKSKNLIN